MSSVSARQSPRFRTPKSEVSHCQHPGDRCIACAHPFARSFASFEPLPLVRRVPERRLPPEEAATVCVQAATVCVQAATVCIQVRFVPERRISQEEALSLVRREPPPRQSSRKEEQIANPWRRMPRGPTWKRHSPRPWPNPRLVSYGGLSGLLVASRTRDAPMR